MTTQRPANVYALLNQPARQILEQIGTQAHVDTPLVRAIVDRELGYAHLAFIRPSDVLEECVIRLETKDPQSAKRILNTTPGVLRAGNLNELRAG